MQDWKTKYHKFLHSLRIIKLIVDWQRKFGASTFGKELMDCVVIFTAQTGETEEWNELYLNMTSNFCPRQNCQRICFLIHSTIKFDNSLGTYSMETQNHPMLKANFDALENIIFGTVIFFFGSFIELKIMKIRSYGSFCFLCGINKKPGKNSVIYKLET